VTNAFYEIGHIARFQKMRKEEVADGDPRGVVWIFEPPRPGATYVMGVDATKGIPGWHRQLRTNDDGKTDNGAIEVLRVGKEGQPDVQVAEYAAPVDPEDLADVCNALGRLYAGRSDDGQCLANVEVWPGPGWMTVKKLIHVHGYTNIWVPKFINTLQPQGPRNVIGWQSNVRSMRDLWIKGTRHLSLGGFIPHSPWLVEEFTDCEVDRVKMTAKASFGTHDDRAIACLLAIWAAHDWSFGVIETTREDVRDRPEPNWQASDISADRLWDQWEERFSEICEE